MGKLTLSALICFLSQINALIACSTGPLHIAAALGKHAIGIYPNIRPMHPGRWKPVGRYVDTITFYKPDCVVCSDRPNQCYCIERIPIKDISQKILAKFVGFNYIDRE